DLLAVVRPGLRLALADELALGTRPSSQAGWLAIGGEDLRRHRRLSGGRLALDGCTSEDEQTESDDAHDSSCAVCPPGVGAALQIHGMSAICHYGGRWSSSIARRPCGDGHTRSAGL